MEAQIASDVVSGCVVNTIRFGITGIGKVSVHNHYPFQSSYPFKSWSSLTVVHVLYQQLMVIFMQGLCKVSVQG